MGDSISPSLLVTSGEQQGCPLRPLLSNIYQDDINKIFDSSCDPVKIGDVPMTSIFWADDLLLLSTSKERWKVKAYCYKWGFVVNTRKTKTTVLSKQMYTPAWFKYGGVPLQAAKSINHLGFVISYNGKYGNLIYDCVMKAKGVSNMVLQALRTNTNVSVRLALSLFDKQITAILLYGCSIWSLPDIQKLIYLINQPEGDNIKDIVFKTIFGKLGKKVSFVYARHVGRNKSDTSGHILIRLKNYCDKDDLLRSAGNSSYVIQNFTVEYKNYIEKVHTSFMKRTPKVSKYSSNKCMNGE